MSARAQPQPDTYANEETPFVSQALFDDLNREHPSEAALDWIEQGYAAALADGRPLVSSEEVMAGIRRIIEEADRERGA